MQSCPVNYQKIGLKPSLICTTCTKGLVSMVRNIKSITSIQSAIELLISSWRIFIANQYNDYMQILQNQNIYRIIGSPDFKDIKKT
jgi:type III secretory pathway component EscU